MSGLKILLVDDHGMLRDSMALLLQHFLKAEILHARTGSEALNLIQENNSLSLILLDIGLPDIPGFQVLDKILLQQPQMPVVMISGYNSAKLIRTSLEHGARGFVPKEASGDIMVAAIKRVLAGDIYTPPEVPLAETRNDDEVLLTPRQLQVLELIRKGLSNADISEVMDIQLSTVKSHVSGIFEQLGVKNRTEAVNEALLLNLFQLSE